MIFKEDIGVVFRITVTKSDGSARDISAATTKEIIFRKPGGTIVTESASLSSGGTDGMMQYAAESGMLDEAGTWKLQGRVVISSTEFHTEIGAFQVGSILE